MQIWSYYDVIFQQPLPKNDEENSEADKEESNATLSEENAAQSCIKQSMSRAKIPTSLGTSPPPPPPPPLQQANQSQLQVSHRDNSVSPGLYQSPVSPLHYAGRVPSPTG